MESKLTMGKNFQDETASYCLDEVSFSECTCSSSPFELILSVASAVSLLLLMLLLLLFQIWQNLLLLYDICLLAPYA